MSPLAKFLFGSLSVAVVVAATLSLRGKSAPAAHPQLTQAQRAEISAPAAARPAPPRMTEPVNDPADLPPPPDDEPDLEDGSGS